MKKITRFMTLVLAAVLALSLTACAPKNAFDFDKDAAIQRAKEVLDVVKTQDYEAIYNAFSDNAKKLTTVDGIKAAFAPLSEQMGAFKELKSTDAISLITKDGTKYIHVYLKATYEKGSYIHTVTFDPDLNLEGFFTK